MGDATKLHFFRNGSDTRTTKPYKFEGCGGYSPTVMAFNSPTLPLIKFTNTVSNGIVIEI